MEPIWNLVPLKWSSSNKWQVLAATSIGMFVGYGYNWWKGRRSKNGNDKTQFSKGLVILYTLAKLRRPLAAFLLNRAITRGANGTKTFSRTYPSYMQSFIKIGVLVLEKNGNKILTSCNFNKDSSVHFIMCFSYR